MNKPIAVAIVCMSMGVAAAEPPAAFTQVNGVWNRSPDGCGTHQLANPSFQGPTPHAVGLRTVYLNKNGATYMLGNATDSAANRVSSQIFDSAPAVITIPPMNTTTFNWPNITACLKTHFKKYNISFVETEPTSGMYIEAVVGGTGQEIGAGANQLFGIASADNFCNVTEKGIAFNFSETHKNVPRRDDELCATIAHEVGHLLALEHEQLPTDLLSYVLIAESNTKAFVDQASGCGVTPQNPSQCSCGGANTNSHGRLAQFIGLRDTEMIAPTLDIDAPGSGDLPPTFDVVATATDNAMMADVVALIDGVEFGNDTVAEANVYKITVRNVSEGPHELTVIAHDAAGNMTPKVIAITVKKSATGESCIEGSACTGGICAQSPDGMFCTQACDVANDTCPSDFECLATMGGPSVCIASEGGGCGCSSTGSPGPMLLLVLAVGGFVLLPRRRRARR